MNEPLPRFAVREVIGFTAAEFLRMGEAGAFEDMKVELIGGEIQRMNPPMGGHSGRQASVIGKLWSVMADADGRLHGEVGIELQPDTIVGCDAALIHRPMLERRVLRPDEVLLAVEVAETTLNRDLNLKRSLYADAGIPHYWVVDGRRDVTHVFAQPDDGDYASVRVVPFGEPLSVPGTDATIVL